MVHPAFHAAPHLWRQIQQHFAEKIETLMAAGMRREEAICGLPKHDCWRAAISTGMTMASRPG